MSPLKFESTVCRVVGAMNPHGIPVPDEVAQFLLDGDTRRVVLEIKGREVKRGLQGSLEFGCYFVVGLGLLKELGVKDGECLSLQVWADPNPDRVDVCDELLIALEQEPDAMARWTEFTTGKQRSLAYHVSSAKREETRIKRALDIAYKVRTGSLHGDG